MAFNNNKMSITLLKLHYWYTIMKMNDLEWGQKSIAAISVPQVHHCGISWFSVKEFNALFMDLYARSIEKKPYAQQRVVIMHTEKTQPFRVATGTLYPHNPLQKRLQKTPGDAKG